VTLNDPLPRRRPSEFEDTAIWAPRRLADFIRDEGQQVPVF